MFYFSIQLGISSSQFTNSYCFTGVGYTTNQKSFGKPWVRLQTLGFQTVDDWTAFTTTPLAPPGPWGFRSGEATAQKWCHNLVLAVSVRKTMVFVTMSPSSSISHDESHWMENNGESQNGDQPKFQWFETSHIFTKSRPNSRLIGRYSLWSRSWMILR